MASLERTLRRQLENTVKQARRVAEAGGRKAIEQLAVHHHEPWSSMSPEQRTLRNRLRAHGRQLGDRRDERRGIQTIDRLVGECAYEHWHRMLFARFLAENDLLIEPETGVPITLAECQELARDKNQDWLEYASSLAVRMLQEIFRPDDPVLQVNLPPETVSVLEDLLKGLPCEVFTAGDSLGWCYQFWQAERKDEVNASGNKIGADELPAVTQLFTEDYMVDFLLDNTLGAWHAGKVLAENPELATNAKDEDELRNAVALPECLWKYLRFVKVAEASSLCNQSQDGYATIWRPAAGTLDGWPKMAKLLTCLDPCMGSGHFEVAMFERLVALRMAEEGMDEATAVAAVIRDNLFGLEIDPRCTQIAAFNLALAAWRRVGYRPLPPMNLACSGLAPNARKDDWIALAGDNEKLQNGMARLYGLFQKAAVLGSLINPRLNTEDMYVADYHELQPLLEEVLKQETKDDTSHEMAVTAYGLAKAAEILASKFTLVATNVPYLKGGEHGAQLKEFCESAYPQSKYDLATVFIQRSHKLLCKGGHLAVVTQQYWLFLKYYEGLRETMILQTSMPLIARLGPNAFDQISGAVVNICLQITSKSTPAADFLVTGLEVDEEPGPCEKSDALVKRAPSQVQQIKQMQNPDKRILLTVDTNKAAQLSTVADFGKGSVSGDGPHYLRMFWEVEHLTVGRKPWLNSPSGLHEWSGREYCILWGEGDHNPESEFGFRFHGQRVFGRYGVAIGKAGSLRPTIYSGELFDDNMAVVCPFKQSDLPAIWAYSSSQEFEESLRRLDKKMSITAGTFTKVPFDLAHWQKIAAEKYPHGLPKPFSSDPTQWLFNGHPQGSDQPLQVAMARLLGYRWPRQTGSSFPDCPALGSDGLESFADDDGIVCLHPVNREQPAASRLRTLLATTFGDAWSAGKERELLAAAGMKKGSLEDWLSDGFFEQHCALFHQRPFIWHIWDGRQDGFNALVNYHRLSAPNGEGHRLLEKMIYTYLGDWITRQRQDQQQGVEGADARLAAALHLQSELKLILAGEPSYDLFVRWKPLHEQAIGWDPDINDGVRMNIRPFMTARPLNAKAKNASILRVTPKIKWDKDRGKEPERSKEDYPWFWGWDEKAKDFTGGKALDGNRWNDLHYTNAHKQSARTRRGGLR